LRFVMINEPSEAIFEDVWLVATSVRLTFAFGTSAPF